MKKLIITGLSCLIASFSINAAAQTSTISNLVDDSQVTGWTYSPNAQATGWLSNQYNKSFGATCTMVSTPAPLSNEQFIKGLLQMGSEAFAREAPAGQGFSLDEMGPFQLTQLDGIPALRYTTRLSANGLALTAFQHQFITKGQLLTVTCGSTTNGFGITAPSLERFMEQMRFNSNLVSAKIENMDENKFPALLANTSGTPAEEISQKTASQSLKHLVESITSRNK